MKHMKTLFKAQAHLAGIFELSEKLRKMDAEIVKAGYDISSTCHEIEKASRGMIGHFQRTVNENLQSKEEAKGI